MTISNEAVTVALQAWRATPFDGDALMNALEAAAPSIRAEALEEAAVKITPDMDPEMCMTIYDPWDVADWLRARAAEMRQG